MLPHQAFGDRHSQPAVNTSRNLEEHVPIITAYVTDRVLKWNDGPDYDKQAYKIISRNGFQNDDYKWLVQLACLYIELLMRTQYAQLDDAITAGCAKAADFILAQLLHRTLKSFNILPANVAELTTTLLRELPVLAVDLGISISAGIDNQGIDMTDPNQIVNVNTPNGVMTMTVAQAVSLGLMAPPQMQVMHQPQFQTGPAGGQQYHQPQYQPQLTPQQIQEYKWQQLQAGRQQQAQQQAFQQNQMPAANMMGQQAAGTMMDPYQQYNNQQNNQNLNNGGNGGAGQAIVPPSGTPIVPNGAGPNVTRSTSSTDTWYEAGTGTDSTSVESTVAQTRAVPEPTVTSDVLIPTTNGYLYPYTYPSEVVENPEINLEQFVLFPMVYDADTHRGLWVLNKHKEVVGFTIKELVGMDYDKHNVAQYFAAQRSHDSVIDKKRTLKLLADVQKKAYIAEKLEIIEPMYDEEGNVVPSKDANVYKFGDPIEIPKLLIGENTTYDYSLRLLRVEGLGQDIHEAMDEAVINYEHQYLQPVVIGEPYASIAMKLKSARTYVDIMRVLDELLECDGIEYTWQYINRTVTEFINNMLQFRFKTTITIQSFYIDYGDLVDYMDESYGNSTMFNATAQELIGSALYPYSKDDEVFDSTWNDGVTVGFGILSDVTILPIVSDEIHIPIPVPDGDTEVNTRQAAVVSSKSYPELYSAIKHRVLNADARASRIVFGTKDGEFFFVHKSIGDSSYVITRTP